MNKNERNQHIENEQLELNYLDNVYLKFGYNLKQKKQVDDLLERCDRPSQRMVDIASTLLRCKNELLSVLSEI